MKVPSYPVGDLSTNPTEFSIQLAQMHLVRLTLETLLAHVRVINSWSIEAPWCDPTRSYVSFPIRVDVTCDQDGYRRVLSEVLNHSGGLGMQSMRLQPESEELMSIQLELTYLTPMNQAWSIHSCPRRCSITAWWWKSFSTRLNPAPALGDSMKITAEMYAAGGCVCSH